MNSRDFLKQIVTELPSRGLDNTNIYISMPLNEYERQSFRIEKITNNGSNDSLFIYITPC